METVVERGHARCPRCVAVAGYVFVELGPNLLRYEVTCRRCGADYREDYGPVPPKFGEVAVVDWQPEVPSVPLRQRMTAWADRARRRAAALQGAAAAAVTAAVALAPRPGRQ